MSEITEVDAQLLTDACLEWATRDDPRIPNGGINYGLAIEHHGMSTQNCRAIMAACAMVGAIGTPRRSARRHQRLGRHQSGPASMYPGADGGSNPASFVRAPFFGLYNRIAGYEKFPMLYWYAVWADCNSVMEYVHRDANAPYEIHAGMIGSGDHMNMANASYNWEALLMLDFLFEANLWHSPTSGAADILLAGVPLSEMNAQRIAQGSGGSFSLCVRAVDPPGRVQERSSVLPGARPLLRRALLHRPGRSLLGEEVGRDRRVCPARARPGVRVPRR